MATFKFTGQDFIEFYGTNVLNSCIKIGNGALATQILGLVPCQTQSLDCYSNCYTLPVFDGDFNNSSLDLEGKLNYFSLDNILLLLSETNFSITHLTRITNDDDSNQTTKNYVIPTETFDSITNDFEKSIFKTYSTLEKTKEESFEKS